MNIRLIRQVALLSLGLCTAMDAVGASAITVTSMGGNTSFVTGGSGTANFSVKVDSDVRPKNKPLQLYFMDKNGGRYATQTTSGASACTGIPNVCANPISLSAGQQCCLQLALDGSQLPPKTYILKAFVGTKPDVPNSVYNGQASDLPITVTSQPTPPTTTTLTITPALALSVNNQALNPALTGNPRTLTIHNTGTQTATGLIISYPNWTASAPGTMATSNCASTLPAGGMCTITITPGATATVDATTTPCSTNGTAPIPAPITVTATNAASSVSSNVVVLSYGCIYQAGYVYSVDDAYADAPISGSVGGKVVAQTDAAPRSPNGQIWSSNGTSPNYSYDIIPGIDENSTLSPSNPSPTYATFEGMFGATGVSTATYTNSAPNPVLPFSTCDGRSDGHCDSGNILLFYNLYQTNYSGSCDPQQGGLGGCLATTPAVISLANYAAGLCYNDTDGGAINGEWYLPAICEMGPASNGSGCSGTQNMVTNLPNLLGVANGSGVLTTACSWGNGGTSSTNCLAGDYWGSTEYSGNPQDGAWDQYFAASGGSNQGYGLNKFALLGVRCSRALTI